MKKRQEDKTPVGGDDKPPNKVTEINKVIENR